eukprot:g912.t1
MLLLVCQFARGLLSNFTARKLCHSGSGTLIMIIDSLNDDIGRAFIFTVVVVSLAMTWGGNFGIPSFRFGRKNDMGITLYLLLVAFWVHNRYSLIVLAPMFFADPAGAIVGKFLSRKLGRLNPKWIGSKTVGGSLAVFLVTYNTIWFTTSKEARLAIATTATLGEGIGGEVDNLFISVACIFGYLLSHNILNFGER